MSDNSLNMERRAIYADGGWIDQPVHATSPTSGTATGEDQVPHHIEPVNRQRDPLLRLTITCALRTSRRTLTDIAAINTLVSQAITTAVADHPDIDFGVVGIELRDERRNVPT